MNHLRPDPDHTVRKRGRERTMVACNPCRDRKQRCNGVHPTCSSCVRRKIQNMCIYEDIVDRTGRKSIAKLPKHVVQDSGRIGSFTPSILKELPPLAPAPIIGTNINVSPNRSSPKVDGLAMVIDTERNESMYGGSSTIALVSQVREAASISSASKSSTIGPNEPNSNPPIQINYKQDIDSFMLPQRQYADSFLVCYWEFIHPVFPILHVQTFILSYEKLWIASPRDSYEDQDGLNQTIFHATLNVVFALGCQYSRDILPENKSSTAAAFYQRSRKLVNFEILDSMNIWLVQFFLLTGVYLQSTEHASRCWNVVGLAIRIAQGMGLHTENHAPKNNQIDREMKRRVWHNCVLLDRLLAMTFGRPVMIKTWDTPIPTIIDDEYLLSDGEGVQPFGNGQYSRMALFVHSLQLFDIMDQILSLFYVEDNLKKGKQSNSSIDPWSVGDLANVLTINSKLDEFKNSLPQYLTTSIAFSIDQPHLMLQASILRSRFLYVRILLLRPILLTSISNRKTSGLNTNAEPGLEQELAISACELCVKTAHLLVEILHQNLNTAYRSSGWHTVYFTFAAATILLAANLSPLLQSSTKDQSFQMSWVWCIEILEHYKVQIRSAERAIQILETLRGKVQSMNEVVHPNTCDLTNILEPPDVGVSENDAVPSVLLEDSNLDVYAMDCMDEAWFTQQLSDLNWLEYQ